MGKVKYREYDSRLMDYIIDYTKEHRVPPTLDQMIENVSGVASKSTLHNHLKNLTSAGLLIQKNVIGSYYPTCLDEKTYIIKESLINEIVEYMYDNIENNENSKYVNILKQLKELIN